MYSAITTATLWGICGEPVTVETDLLPGLPGLSLVGLPQQSVKESKERVKSALINSGYGFPGRKITVNLSPADRRKEGSHFDLPIAVGILCASGLLPQEKVEDYAMMGELSLNGQLHGVTGALPLVLGLRSCGWKKIILPVENQQEMELITDVELYPASHLTQVVEHFHGSKNLVQMSKDRSCDRLSSKMGQDSEGETIDYLDVIGQEEAKRCVVLACGGMHGLLLQGSPGVGKSMIARRIPTVLPALTEEERLEVTRIYSAAGLLKESGLKGDSRPFRAPHYGISPAAMIGSGSRPRPGEVSLAHCGVLFLDELPLFSRKVLEMLRTPVEDGEVTICRAWGTFTFPSRFMLVAAMNPCRCGYYGDAKKACTCTPSQLKSYQDQLSGPLLDRMDLQVYMNRPPLETCTEGERSYAVQRMANLSSAQMRQQIGRIRQRQKERYQGERILYNSQLTPGLIKKFCKLEPEAKTLMSQYIERFSVSLRSQHRILKVARTAADSEGCRDIGVNHLAEALRYRRD